MRPQRRRDKHKRFFSPRNSLILCGIVLVLVAILCIALDSYRSDSSPWTPVSQREIKYAVMTNPTLSENRQIVVDSALSLVGKVHYFWGGKSDAIGWDKNWGKRAEVTSEGSSTTGTTRPMGLDCSGFVTWCFIQTGYTWDEAVALVGNGTVNQFALSTEIEWDMLQPGDLVFQHEPGDPDGNHVGICIGFDRDGEPLFAHCAAGENNVVVTRADDIFQYARRPNVYENTQ